MARLTRITPSGVPIHVIQRGNNRQVIFAKTQLVSMIITI